MVETEKKDLNAPLVSIIIPVYNVAMYLRQCLDSVIAQTYNNWEIILVDDGSEDASGEICDEYSQKNQKISSYHITNGGQGAARNYALQYAAGEYIAFMDSDDVITADYLQILVHGILQNKADISCCSFIKFAGNRIPNKDIAQEIEYKVYNSEKALENLCYQREMSNSPCCKLIKKEIVNKFPFPVGTGYEDLAVVYRWLDTAERIVYCPVNSYYYRQLSTGTMRSKFSRKKLDRLFIADEMRSFISGKYPQLREASDARFFLSNIQTLMWLPMKKQYREYYMIISKNIKSVRKSVINNSEVRFSRKVMALSSYLGISGLRMLGEIYRRIYSS